MGSCSHWLLEILCVQFLFSREFVICVLSVFA